MTLRAVLAILVLCAIVAGCVVATRPEPVPPCAIEDPEKDGGIGGTGQRPPPCPES